MSDLAGLINRQRDFMHLIGVPTEPATEVTDPRINTCVLGLTSEVGEVAQEINFKTRKWAESDQKILFGRLAEESIDILFYLLEELIIMGYDHEDVVQMYEAKLAKNVRRFLRSCDRDMVTQVLGHLHESIDVNGMSLVSALLFTWKLKSIIPDGFDLIFEALLLAVRVGALRVEDVKTDLVFFEWLAK